MNETTVRIFRDGDQVCALIGADLMEGTAGFGPTISEALRDLADNFENQCDQIV